MGDSVDEETDFETQRRTARELLDENSITAFYLGVIHDGETADTMFAQTAEDREQEGLQALSLLATHIRIVANESGADLETVAGDAATIAGRLEGLSPDELANVRKRDDH